ncbi:MAG: STAS domain-containing protein [Fibrobacter sp.]|nr:STAS domain-containing protein [Fibrobacter sp.]
MSIRIQMDKLDSQPLLRIRGEITKETIGKITSKINRISKLKIDIITLDLSETAFIDSCGLGAFVYLWRSIKEDKKELQLLNPSPIVRDLLEESNLDKCFTIISNGSDR